MKKLEKFLKAFANHRRLEIVWFLNEKGPVTVSEISARINLSFKATSKHLGVLFAADIVEREQKGLQMFYRIAPDKRRKVLAVFGLSR